VNKKTMVRSVVLIPAILMMSLLVGPPGRPVAATGTCANSIFGPTLASLRAGTQIPLRLPLVVGGAYDEALYAEVGWVSRTRYMVRIGQNCERSYCPYGTVSGAKISKRTPRPRGQAVELIGGVRGYLTDGSENLRDSIVTWDEGQYRYAVAIYAAEPAAIIKVANSALSCVNQ
jgi:hypothetical protein